LPHPLIDSMFASVAPEEKHEQSHLKACLDNYFLGIA